MLPYFSDLGTRLLAEWKATNFSLAAFPSIAAGALQARPPSEHVSVEDLVHDMLLNDEQHFQSSSGFGEPELIVYDHPKFYIQTLFWLDGTTDIHQHEFSGAFHLLAGSSLHSHYTFQNIQPVTPFFRLGDLTLQESRLLEVGSTTEIVSGSSCIHSLFHLDTPSVTVVVRTHSDPGTGPQFTYLPPHIALDPTQDDPLTLRRKQLLDLLEATEDTAYPRIVTSMIRDLDLERGFFILQNSLLHLRRTGHWDEVWHQFADRHGDVVSPIAPTLNEIIRRDTLVAMRRDIHEVPHRFLLSLLIAQPARSIFLQIVAQRYPGDPIETILQWAEELLNFDEEGAFLLDAHFPEIEEAEASCILNALRSALVSRHPTSSSTAEEREIQGHLKNSSWRSILS